MPPTKFAPQTPAKLAHIAKELRAMADDLDRSTEVMKALKISEMEFPRGDSLEKGIQGLRTFTDATRDTLRDVGLEVSGGNELHIAVKNVVSDLRDPKRKKTDRGVSRLRASQKTDKRK